MQYIPVTPRIPFSDSWAVFQNALYKFAWLVLGFYETHPEIPTKIGQYTSIEI